MHMLTLAHEQGDPNTPFVYAIDSPTQIDNVTDEMAHIAFANASGAHIPRFDDHTSRDDFVAAINASVSSLCLRLYKDSDCKIAYEDTLEKAKRLIQSAKDRIEVWRQAMPEYAEPKTPMERIANSMRDSIFEPLELAVQRESGRINKIANKWATKIAIASMQNDDMKHILQCFIPENKYASKALKVFGKAHTSDTSNRYSLANIMSKKDYTEAHKEGDSLVENTLGGDSMGDFLMYHKSLGKSYNSSELTREMMRHTVGFPVRLIIPSGAVMDPFLITVASVDATYLADAQSLLECNGFQYRNGPLMNSIVPITSSPFSQSWICSDEAVQIFTLLATHMPGISHTSALFALIAALVGHLLSHYADESTGVVTTFAAKSLTLLAHTTMLYERGLNFAKFSAHMMLPNATSRCYATATAVDRFLGCSSVNQILFALWKNMQTTIVTPEALRNHFIATLVEMTARGVRIE